MCELQTLKVEIFLPNQPQGIPYPSISTPIYRFCFCFFLNFTHMFYQSLFWLNKILFYIGIITANDYMLENLFKAG